MSLLIFLWVLYSVAEAYEDSQYAVILDHKPTVYPRIVIGVITLFLWATSHALTLPECLAFAFVLISVFWFVFELSGNLFRGNYFSYIGSISSWDKKLKPYEGMVFFLRFFLMGLAFALYYRNELNIY